MTELQNNHAAKGRIIAVCSAPKKGMIKHDIGEGTLIEGIGVKRIAINRGRDTQDSVM